MITEGEMEDIPTHLAIDNLAGIRWRMADGNIIYVKDMDDKHLRNAALFLMGMGYTECILTEHKRVIYLRVFSMEWKRRMGNRTRISRKWNVNVDDGLTVWHE